MLPNQWSLNPVGTQVAVGDFPVNMAIHPGGRFAVILHCGYGTHEVVVLDINRARVFSRVPLEQAFYGLAFSADGTRLFVSGAGQESVEIFDFKDGYLAGGRSVALRDASRRGVAAGLAVRADAQRLWVANLLGQSITTVDLATMSADGEIALGDPSTAPPVAPGGRLQDADADAVTKRARALLESANDQAPFPYACAIDEGRQRLYVSLWAQAAVAVIDLRSGKPLVRWGTEEHPNEMVLTRSGEHLLVANANRNTVSVIDTTSGRTLETLVSSLEPNALPGSTPNSLALSPDEKRLFVANANINAVAVFDVSIPGHSRSLGLIPAGWYPTSVRVTPDGKRLLIANGKGLMSKANRYGPQPGRDAPASLREYIGGLFQGTIGILDLPNGAKFEEKLREYTERCRRCAPGGRGAPLVKRAKGHPVPARRGEPTPLRYCIYVIKENRTYDQLLGDMPEGNGDPALCLFPERITPNHHQLAREFVLLDNFYVESEVSADGHEWSVGAYATDYVEKLWPMSYGHNQGSKYTYPSEGRFKIAAPAEGYLWDRAREAGVSYRSYGEFINNGTTTNDPCTTRVLTLEDHFDPWFRSFDMEYSDRARADRFIAELHRFEREGEMPQLQIVRLPSDHTVGTGAGKLTPTAFVADNDLALGRLVEAVSHSKFWAQTAIFVVEDDAQNGPDHVDAHRTVAYAISPYSRRGAVDSTLYSTASMLRTMELILGLRPMSQFDAAAAPMFDSFQARANTAPYRARMPQADFNERNGAMAWGSDLSDQMDFAREDAADDLLLNEVIWRSVRGATAAMPPPRRAAFVLAGAEDEE